MRELRPSSKVSLLVINLQTGKTKGCLQSRRCGITSQHCDMWDIRRFEIVEKHSYLVHTPRTICFSVHQNRFENSSLRCHISALWYEVAGKLNGSRRILGVRESASLSCRTCSGLLFTSQILTAQRTLVTNSSTSLSPPIMERTSVIFVQVK